MESIGDRLQRLRQARNLSVREMSELTGIPQSTYREWEYGREIKGEPYVKIAEALNVTLYELLTGEVPKHQELLRKIEKLESNIRELRKSLESFF